MVVERASEVAAAVRTVVRGRLSRYAGHGPSTTDRFETELASFVGVDHALAVNSGTSALFSALAALHVGPGDEVLVPGTPGSPTLPLRWRSAPSPCSSR